MATNVKITFNSLPQENTDLQITDSLGTIILESFVPERTGAFQVEANYYLTDELTLSLLAINYQDAIDLDYNITSLYTVSRDINSNTVTITANNPNSQFSVTGTNPAISTVVNNSPVPESFFYLNEDLQEATTNNPDDYVKISSELNIIADSITSPISQAVSVNPFTFETLRSGIIDIIFAKNSQTVSKQLYIPKLLSTFFNVTILNTPSKASVTVNNSFLYALDISLEYSLNGVLWQESNVFNNVDSGNYTVYVRDNIGSQTSLDFEINAFTPNLLDYDGICEVSNLNSIRYKKVEDWNVIPKNNENTLSFEEEVKVRNNAFTQLFQQNDIVRTQIKTNYETVTAKLIDKNNTETTLTVEKKSSNMEVTDVRDGENSVVSYNGSNYVALTFKNGKTYDPITLAENGSYNLGENLPDWMNAGDYVNIQGFGWHKVLDTVFTNGANALVLNLLSDSLGLGSAIRKISSIYNTVNYERYEFDIDFYNKEGFYKVQIDVEDSNFGSKQFLSEWLNIKETHKNTFHLKAYNSVFNEINFNTGYYVTLRIPFATHLIWKPNTENDIYVTDTNTVNLESKYRSFWGLNLNPVPSAMAEKITLALSQDRLFIDGVNYVNESEIESAKVGGQYQIKTTLVKSNYVFDSNLGKGVSENTTYKGVPLAIDDNVHGLLFVED